MGKGIEVEGGVQGKGGIRAGSVPDPIQPNRRERCGDVWKRKGFRAKRRKNN